MKKPLCFEKVQPDEAARLGRLATNIYAQHYTDLWDDRGRRYMDEAFSLSQLRGELQTPSIRYYYVRKADEAVGFIKIILPDDNDRDAGLYLERLYLDSETTGQGLGQRCLSFAEAEAGRYGFGHIWLKAMTYREDVCRFYRRHGYVERALTKLTAPGISAGLENMIIFEKQLGS